jgi:hypothetical protein
VVLLFVTFPRNSVRAISVLHLSACSVLFCSVVQHTAAPRGGRTRNTAPAADIDAELSQETMAAARAAGVSEVELQQMADEMMAER